MIGSSFCHFEGRLELRTLSRYSKVTVTEALTEKWVLVSCVNLCVGWAQMVALTGLVVVTTQTGGHIYLVTLNIHTSL